MLREALSWCGTILSLVIIAGLFARRHVRAAALLPVLLAWTAAVNLTLFVRPDLLTWPFWIGQELVGLALTGLLGLEIGARLSTHLPGLRRKLTWEVILWGLTAAALLSSLPPGPISTHLLPALAVIVGGFFTLVLFEATLFFLPLSRLHRTLLVGVSLSSFVYAIALSRMIDDTTVADYTNVLMSLAFLVALAAAAWQREEAPPRMEPRVVSLLWPWHP
jgi:hypothetical protein